MFGFSQQLWFCRLSLLTRLKLYEMADSEIQAFHALDSPDLYFEFYPVVFPGRRGKYCNVLRYKSSFLLCLLLSAIVIGKKFHISNNKQSIKKPMRVIS